MWGRCRRLLVKLGVLIPIAPKTELNMRDDLQIVWKNPTPPLREKAQLSKGWSGDRLAIYPNGRQVWFDDVSGGHALPESGAGNVAADDQTNP